MGDNLAAAVHSDIIAYDYLARKVDSIFVTVLGETLRYAEMHCHTVILPD